MERDEEQGLSYKGTLLSSASFNPVPPAQVHYLPIPPPPPPDNEPINRLMLSTLAWALKGSLAS